MFTNLFGLVSSDWGVARFVTDLIALSALSILVALPILLLKSRVNAKQPWAEGNALSDR